MGCEYRNQDYLFVRDALNNITAITHRNKRIVARYKYDTWGNCTVYNEDGEIDTDPISIGNVNPFRWKSLYYDTESGLYYANGSYYDPTTGLYVDASSIESVIENGLSSNRLDRNSLMCNNVLEFNQNSVENRPKHRYYHKREVDTYQSYNLPTIPKWVGYASNAVSAGFSISVVARTGWYAYHYSGLTDLMRLDGITTLPGKYTNFVNGLSYGFVALDTFFDIYSNIQQDKSAGYVIGSAIYTAGTGIGIIWASGKLGAMIGTAIGGPIGFIVGGIVGIVVGGLLTILSNWLKGELFK